MTRDGRKILMLLGGIHYLIPVIKAAHEQGYYVITADYLPENIAHKYSDEYVNVSIIDKEAVLIEAKKHQIDGIISFGVDPGVISAAYVQEKMCLPSMGPYESVVILQNKNLFREFLQENGFNMPKYKSYIDKSIAMEDTEWIKFPVIVKPVDSAGSKGVTKVDSFDDYGNAIDVAFANSVHKRIIVEEFLKADGCSSDSDCFSVNGILKVVSFNSQRFDVNSPNPFTPAAFTWPSTMILTQENYLTSEIQRLLQLLKMGTTIYNIETRVCNGVPYIMEVSPRGGGNRLSEMLKLATDVDLITAQVRAAVGDSIDFISQRSNPDVIYKKHIAYMVLHTSQNGKFAGLFIDEKFYKSHQVEPLDLWVENGDYISGFTGSNTTIGTLPLQFDTEEEMLSCVSNIGNYLNVCVEGV